MQARHLSVIQAKAGAFALKGESTTIVGSFSKNIIEMKESFYFLDIPKY